MALLENVELKAVDAAGLREAEADVLKRRTRPAAEVVVEIETEDPRMEP